MMKENLLSFEFDEKNEVLMIHGDPEGLRKLSDSLSKLIANTKDGHFNHSHLMTPEWGGNELSSANQGGKVVNHVKVYCWKGSELQKS